jgi:phosphoribosylaminoimidazole (AIR) synthetase
LDATAWPVPAVFRWLGEVGGVAPQEMARTFNCGIGMVLVVAPTRTRAVTAALTKAGERVHRIGNIVRGKGPARTRLSNMGPAWPC